MIKRKRAYSIQKIYADCSSIGEEFDLVEVQLKISLGSSAWRKFQAQPFYQELIRYLDNVESPEQGTGIAKEQKLCEKIMEQKRELYKKTEEYAEKIMRESHEANPQEIAILPELLKILSDYGESLLR